MIEELLDHIGIEDLRPNENEIGGRCPAHEKRTGEREHRPDHFSVNRSTGLFHCFSCAYSGSLVTLVMDVAQVGLWDAHQLIRHFDVELGTTEDDVWEPPVPSADLETQLAQFGSPPERATVKRRVSPESISRFGVRWDEEESAWVFPIYGPECDLWGWQSKTAEWVRNHPPGVHKSRTLFGIHAQVGGVSIILVESPLDVVYLDGLGYPAVASFGAAVSDAQMRLLIENFDELILALDNDRVGRKEMRRILEERWHHRMPVQIFNYWQTNRKDPGELTPEQIENGLMGATLAGFW